MAAVCVAAASVFGAACGGDAEPAAEPPPLPVETPATTEAPPATTQAMPPTGETPPEPPPTTAAEPPPPEPTPLPGPGLPRQILGYQDWLKLNEDPIRPNPDGDPHLGTKDVYASQRAERSGDSLAYPDGTIIVKEAARPDTDFIGLVAIMRKEAGADPEHGDWIFTEYTRDRAGSRFALQARDEVCWSCHVGAQATDWVWVHTTGAAP